MCSGLLTNEITTKNVDYFVFKNVEPAWSYTRAACLLNKISVDDFYFFIYFNKSNDNME